VVAGTAPLESVELFRWGTCLYRHPLEAARSPHRVRLLWEGASRKTSYSGVIWEGSLQLQGASGASIASVSCLRFDSPRSHVYDLAPAGVRWRSVTCGYRSGLLVDLAGVDDATSVELQCVVSTSLISRPFFGDHGERGAPRMAFAPAERVAFAVGLDELAARERAIEIGPLGRRLTMSLAPAPGGPRTAEFTFADEAPQPGVNAYWVRVVQTDLEMAWTSPVFVDYVAP
jgi:hypothetical protein